MAFPLGDAARRCDSKSPDLRWCSQSAQHRLPGCIGKRDFGLLAFFCKIRICRDNVKSFQKRILNNGFELQECLAGKLGVAYAKCEDQVDAVDGFDKMSRRDVVVSWSPTILR